MTIVLDARVCFSRLPSKLRLTSIGVEASLQSRYWRSPFIEPTFNEQGARLEKSVRCAKFRQTEMPKEPRRAPTVYDGFMNGPLGTAQRVGFCLLAAIRLQPKQPQPLTHMNADFEIYADS